MTEDLHLVHYTEGYLYQTEENFEWSTGIKPIAPGGNRFVTMGHDGVLFVKAGYAWDGASGPAINTKSFVRASLVHDALYQLIRLGVVATDDRVTADRLLRDILIKDGARWEAVRAQWVYAAVRWFGGTYMKMHDTSVLTAP